MSVHAIETVDIPFRLLAREDDLRAAPEFARLRHEVWGLLRDEFRQAGVLERDRLTLRGAASSRSNRGKP
jgi:NitT/TauT family transport system ATP-binding protein